MSRIAGLTLVELDTPAPDATAAVEMPPAPPETPPELTLESEQAQRDVGHEDEVTVEADGLMAVAVRVSDGGSRTASV